MQLRTLAFALALIAGFATHAAADPPQGKVTIMVAPKGGVEIVGNGLISTTTTTDRLIFILIGTGRATFTLFDGDLPGDTVTANGTLAALLPTTFTASATSPAQIQETLLVPLLGILVVDVGYSSIVNPVPAQYIYKLDF